MIRPSGVLAAADPLNHSLGRNLFACVLDFGQGSRDRDRRGDIGTQFIEVEFERGGLVADTPSHFADRADGAVDLRADGEVSVVIALDRRGQDGADLVAGLCREGRREAR